MNQGELTLISSDSCHRLALWRGHVLAIWYGEASVEATLRAARFILETARARPKRAAYIVILRDSLRMPSAEVREIWIQLGRQLGDDLSAVVAVVEGSGFGASSTRAMITGLGLAARAIFPLRAFATIEEAGGWARSRVESAGGALGTSFELAAAFAELGE